jgi:hypothetical protein
MPPPQAEIAFALSVAESKVIVPAVLSRDTAQAVNHQILD